MKTTGITAIIALCACLAARAEPAGKLPAELENSVVEVIVTYQKYSAHLPWQKLKPGTRTGYGVFVGQDRILTSESLLRNNTLVEIRKVGAGRKTPVKVHVTEPQVDLALLDIDSGKSEYKCLPLAAKAEKDEQVIIAQFSGSDNIQLGGGKILEPSVQSLPFAPHSCLIFKVLTDLNVDARGAPVLKDNKLAGIVLSYNRNSRTAKVLPYPLIRRFINDAKRKPFEGFASAGFLWSPLIDPAKRSYLKLQNDPGGILVLDRLPGTGADKVLRSNDVIVQWDGYPIDRLGYYKDPDFGKMRLPHLIHGKRKAGESAKVSLVRDGRKMQVELPLQRMDDDNMLIPENYLAEQPSYIVEGGFVIRELTGRYLKAHGRNWKKRLPSALVHLYMSSRFSPEKVGDKVVIVSQILPDPINIGYQQFNNRIVTHANGTAVKNLGDVFNAIELDGNLTSLRLRGMEIDLVLDRKSIERANSRLASKYRIAKLRQRTTDK